MGADKDAHDIFRLLRGTETDDLSARYRKLLADARSADAAKAGMALLAQQFCVRGAIGIRVAACTQRTSIVAFSVTSPTESVSS